MDLQPNEKEVIEEALRWYIDDRQECATAEERQGFEEAAEEHRESARRAGHVLNTLQKQDSQPK